jgi:hypothetical protein
MIRADRPFDRWFDLADPYDDSDRRRPTSPRPEADREWTYDPAPKRRGPAPRDVGTSP